MGRWLKGRGEAAQRQGTCHMSDSGLFHTSLQMPTTEYPLPVGSETLRMEEKTLVPFIHHVQCLWTPWSRICRCIRNMDMQKIIVYYVHGMV